MARVQGNDLAIAQGEHLEVPVVRGSRPMSVDTGRVHDNNHLVVVADDLVELHAEAAFGLPCECDFQLAATTTGLRRGSTVAGSR